MSMYFKPKEKSLQFWDAIDELLINIGKDYDSWNGVEPPRAMDKATRRIKEESSQKFKDGLKFKIGRKYTKVIQGSSVWGFIANSDGVLKGIPYLKGDVFKAAGWAAPAKHVRGSIFDNSTNWFHWTGPRYL